MAPRKGKKAKKEKLAPEKEHGLIKEKLAPEKEKLVPEKEKLELRTDQEQIERPVNNEAVWEKAFESTIKRWNKLQPIKEVIENGGKKVVSVGVKGDRFCSRCQTRYPDLTMHVDMVYGYNTRSGKGEIRVVKENKSWCDKCRIEARIKTSKPIIDEDTAKRAADYVFHIVKQNFYDHEGSKDKKPLSDPILWEFYYGKIN